MRVQDVMVRDVVTIDASATLVEAAQQMAQANVGVLPVIEDGELRGVLTDRDVVVRAIAREVDPRSTRAVDCATAEVFAARPEWGIDQARPSEDLAAAVRRAVTPGSDAERTGQAPAQAGELSVRCVWL